MKYFASSRNHCSMKIGREPIVEHKIAVAFVLKKTMVRYPTLIYNLANGSLHTGLRPQRCHRKSWRWSSWVCHFTKEEMDTISLPLKAAILSLLGAPGLPLTLWVTSFLYSPSDLASNFASPPPPSIPRWIPHLVSHSQRCNPQRFCNYEIANTLWDWFEKCIKKEGIADIFSTKVGLGGGNLWRLLCLLPSIIHLRPIWDRKTICTLLQSKLLCNLSQGL